jgi:hypothetical protein
MPTLRDDRFRKLLPTQKTCKRHLLLLFLLRYRHRRTIQLIQLPPRQIVPSIVQEFARIAIPAEPRFFVVLADVGLVVDEGDASDVGGSADGTGLHLFVEDVGALVDGGKVVGRTSV